ncbi:MAG TPA: TldD/PmbA family protein [Acidimicrobiia bacterium]|jgi:TldD protein
MFDLAQTAVEGALAAGATYADARGLESRRQAITVQNGSVEGADLAEEAGIGVRALIGSSWGFYAVAEPSSEAARKAGESAAAIAKASAMVPGPAQVLAEVAINQDEYKNPVDEDPFSISLSEKVDLLIGLTSAMQETEGVALARANLNFWDSKKWFVSSQGHRIFQQLVESGGGMSALAVGERETQVRSYPQSFGQYETGGYEIVRRWDFPAHAQRIAEEAVALLTAAEMEEGEKTLILDAAQVALQIHESVGHAIELDRILGWEAAFAGTSHLELDKLNQHKYGSPLMNITADATLPGALGTFGYDDEGTPAQRVDIVKEGTWVGVLSGRDSAAIAGLPPGGMVRGDGYNRLPMVRMTNVGLLPGSSSRDEMIADTQDGYVYNNNRSWSIDDRRLNFQFGCEAAWEVKNGKLGKMVKNPTYTGITPQFWGSMDMVGSESEWVLWGLPNCGKGQPIQLAHTAHPAVPARFQSVRVGVRG